MLYVADAVRGRSVAISTTATAAASSTTATAVTSEVEVYIVVIVILFVLHLVVAAAAATAVVQSGLGRRLGMCLDALLGDRGRCGCRRRRGLLGGSRLRWGIIVVAVGCVSVVVRNRTRGGRHSQIGEEILLEVLRLSHLVGGRQCLVRIIDGRIVVDEGCEERNEEVKNVKMLRRRNGGQRRRVAANVWIFLGQAW